MPSAQYPCPKEQWSDLTWAQKVAVAEILRNPGKFILLNKLSTGEVTYCTNDKDPAALLELWYEEKCNVLEDEFDVHEPQEDWIELTDSQRTAIYRVIKGKEEFLLISRGLVTTYVGSGRSGDSMVWKGRQFVDFVRKTRSAK